MRLCAMFFIGSQTSQDKTSNAESFDRESATSCRIYGCLSDVAKEIADSPLALSKLFQAFVFLPKRTEICIAISMLWRPLQKANVCIFKTKIMQFQRAPKRCIKRFRPLVTDLENLLHHKKAQGLEKADISDYSSPLSHQSGHIILNVNVK